MMELSIDREKMGTFCSFPREFKKGMKIQMARNDADVEMPLVAEMCHCQQSQKDWVEDQQIPTFSVLAPFVF